MQIKQLFFIIIPFAIAAPISPDDEFHPRFSASGVRLLRYHINTAIQNLVDNRLMDFGPTYYYAYRQLVGASVDALPDGYICPDPEIGDSPSNRIEALVEMEKTLSLLDEVRRDIKGRNFPKAERDICRAVAQFDNVGSYVRNTRKHRFADESVGMDQLDF